MPQPRVYLIGNPDKQHVREVFEELRAWIPARAELVGSAVSLDVHEVLAKRPDRVIVLGGDGTLLGVAGKLAADQLPLVGVNLGKLGYLAEFTVEALKAAFDRVVADADLIIPRMMLDLQINGAGASPVVERAVNDFVIRDGAPFRMIELAIRVNGDFLTRVTGDGLIVATPTGSTAYNMSAGGPILRPGTSGIVLTPICPHSLAHRPLVVESDAAIEVTARKVNAGTVISIDGQRILPLRVGQQLLIGRSPHSFLLVRNPEVPRWHTLVTKLKWGVSPAAS